MIWDRVTKILLPVSVTVFLLAVIYASVTFYRLRRPVEPEVSDTGSQASSTPAIVQKPVRSTATDESLDIDSSIFASQYVAEDVEEDSADIPTLEAYEDWPLTENENGADDVSPDTAQYPEVPEGFPLKPIWTKPEGSLSAKGRERVARLQQALIALWNRGDHDFISGVSENGKVYPMYPNTIYVRWNDEMVGSNGKIVRGISEVTSAGGVLSDKEHDKLIDGIVPSHIRVIDMDSAGYDIDDLLSDFE